MAYMIARYDNEADERLGPAVAVYWHPAGWVISDGGAVRFPSRYEALYVLGQLRGLYPGGIFCLLVDREHYVTDPQANMPKFFPLGTHWFVAARVAN